MRRLRHFIKARRDVNNDVQRQRQRKNCSGSRSSNNDDDDDDHGKISEQKTGGGIRAEINK